MHCERAQEFFSDYIEQSLERPMLVTLEAHLEGCRNCREELETLRTVFQSLETVPDVAPPPDSDWRVIRRLRELRMAEAAARPRSPSFVDWLRSLSPISAAFGAGLATLVAAGAFMLHSAGSQTQLKVVDLPYGNAPRPRQPDANAQPLLSTRVSVGAATANGQPVTVLVQPGRELQDARVEVTAPTLSGTQPGAGNISPNAPAVLPLMLPATVPADVLEVKVTAPALPQEQKFLVAVPLGQPRPGPVTLAFSYQPAAEALRQLVPFVGRPIVVDGVPQGQVTLQVDKQPAAQCLRDLAEQLRYRVEESAAGYHLVPQP
jgi:hypothetical protein